MKKAKLVSRYIFNKLTEDGGLYTTIEECQVESYLDAYLTVIFYSIKLPKGAELAEYGVEL